MLDEAVVRTEVRAAASAVIEAAMRDLAKIDYEPHFGPMPDFRRWHRHGQETFSAVRRSAWQMPERVTHIGWLDSFGEMTQVREALDADRKFRDRIDGLVGVEFHMSQRQLPWMVIVHLLEPMVTKSHSYSFSRKTFDEAYIRLEAGLLADHARMVEFMPLNAFTGYAGVGPVEIGDGIALQPMTDTQLSEAIRVSAVPHEFGGGPTNVTVSHFDQWGITTERTYPIHTASDLPRHPGPPASSSMLGDAKRVITALRLVCGGSVVATRPMLAQHDADFPLISGASTALTALPAVNYKRPTLLAKDRISQLQEIHRLLSIEAVRRDDNVQMALRRVVLAGAQQDPIDRLVDLMICAEVLFIKRQGARTRAKSRPVAEATANLLADDDDLALSHQQIHDFMLAASNIRNAEMHGDDPHAKQPVQLDSSPAPSLETMVDDLERVIRRALIRTLLAAYGRNGHSDPS